MKNETTNDNQILADLMHKVNKKSYRHSPIEIVPSLRLLAKVTESTEYPFHKSALQVLVKIHLHPNFLLMKVLHLCNMQHLCKKAFQLVLGYFWISPNLF